MYSLLNALPEGAEHVWSFLEKERFAKELEFDRERKGFLQDNKDLREGLLREREGFLRERESFLRERESLREGFLRERESFLQDNKDLREGLLREREGFLRERESLREGFLREREGFSRERNFLIDREALAVATLQKQIDHSEGLITVRAMLERIVTSEFPNRSATDALRNYCEKKDFVEYLDLVGKATNFSTANLIKSAKGAYGMMSNPIHNGSTHSTEVSSFPQSVVHDKCTLHAIAAIFKFERRDVCFYVGGPSSLLKIPSPPRSGANSEANSAGKLSRKLTAQVFGQYWQSFYYRRWRLIDTSHEKKRM